MDSNIIDKAAEVIRKGGLVLFPSDTVYILAVDPTNQNAVDKLLAFKNRWTGKAISVAVADKKMAEKYVVLSDNAIQLYNNLLPGPFTIVSAGKHKVSKGIEAENGTLGIRIPDNQWIKELVTILGKPVTATSANLSGRTPNYSATGFLKTLSKKKREMIDLVVDAGKLPKNKPSTVIDATEPELKVLRRGDLVTTSATTIISKSEKETGKVAEFLLKKSLVKSRIQNHNHKYETHHTSPSLRGAGDLPAGRHGAAISKSKPTHPSGPPSPHFGGSMDLDRAGAKPMVFLLSGDLGCGKTVFSKQIAKSLGYKGKVTSPTFVIYNIYEIQNPKVKTHPLIPSLKNGGEIDEAISKSKPTHPSGPPSPHFGGSMDLDRAGKIEKFIHMDLYRITADFELEEIKFFELFAPNTIACIEWPENMGEENLAKLGQMAKLVKVTFEYVDEKTRELRYEI